nr:baseplate J/gp47 family protein [uncultured Blautia sp.]
MDSSELHFIECDPEKLWDKMIENYVNEGGDILYPGDEKEMLLRSVQADIVQVSASVDNALLMMTLRKATGIFLDVYGERNNCNRIEASTATATVQIITNATGKSQTLPAGTAMTHDGEIYYLLTDDITLTGYEQTITANIIADREGLAGNALPNGAEMVLAITNSAINSIVTTSAATGGNEEEEDEAYRERIRKHGLTSVTTGPYQQYESIAEGVSSAIIDAKALNLGGGNVGVYLILSDESSQNNILQNVLDTLSSKNVRPLNDHVTVHMATKVNYTINVQYTSDNSSSTTEAITQAVHDYKDWQDHTIGRAFNPDRLMASIYQAGATRVTWLDGSRFKDSSNITYTEIKESEHCNGVITLTASVS